MTLQDPQRRATRRPSPSKTRPKAVHDNVLGRRPSKSDPLGEQPGTVAKNPELDVATAPRAQAAEPARRAKKKS